jgi:hypothetical protein
MTFTARTLLRALAAALLLPALAGGGSGAESPHEFALGGRYHARHSAFDELPFGNADLSYALAYNFVKDFYMVQFACDVAPSVEGPVAVSNAPAVKTDYALTPQANFILRDRIFRGGGGIRTSYLNNSEGDSQWLDPYWQFLLGLSVPLAKHVSVDAQTYYVFSDFGKLDQFSFYDLEYGLWLNYRF